MWLLRLLLVCAAAVSADFSSMLPPMGWSSWNLFQTQVNETAILQQAHALISSNLTRAGYRYLLIDDGWTQCLQFDSSGNCLKVPPRNRNDNTIPIDRNKFPRGFAPLTAQLHSLGLKVGIYTAVSTRTCGGFIGSLNYEAVDGAWFVAQGFDFVKSDTCNIDCPIHNGCIQNSTARMRAALNAGKNVVYYIDSGNPTSPARVFNPRGHHVTDVEYQRKIAVKPSELVWVWAKGTAQMFKSWFDIVDTYHSTLSNAWNQIRVAEYQQCGTFNNPDFLTMGLGAQTFPEYRTQFLLWAVLGAPLILSGDARKFSSQELALLQDPQILAVAQDPECVQGSMIQAYESGEVWARPLSAGDFAVVFLNKSPSSSLKISITIIENAGGYSNFYPASLPNGAKVYDVLERKHLGSFLNDFSAIVSPHDARMFLFTPI